MPKKIKFPLQMVCGKTIFTINDFKCKFDIRKNNSLIFLKPIARNDKMYIENMYNNSKNQVSDLDYKNILWNTDYNRLLCSNFNLTSSSTLSSSSLCTYGLELI